MKTKLSLAILAIAAASGAALAATAHQQGSFDFQLNQAKATIAQNADEGLQRATSFDTQLNQAKATIAKMAEDGLKAQASTATPTK